MVAMVALALAAASSMTASAVSVRDIIEAADISGVAASPDGKLVAYRVERASIEANDYDLAWYVVSVDGTAPPRKIGDGGKVLFTDAGTLAPEMPLWSPDSRKLYFRAAGDEGVQVWRASADGSFASVVTHDASDVASFDIASDGRTLTYRGGATRDAVARAKHAALDDGVLVDKTIDMAQPLAGGAIVAGRRTMKRFTGRWFSRGPLLWDTRLRQMNIDLTTGIESEGLTRDAIAAPTGIVTTEAVAANGDRAITVESAQSQSFAIRRTDGTTIQCAATLCRRGAILGAAWRPGSDALLLATRNGTRGNAYALWQVGSTTTRTVVRTEGALNGGRDPRAQCAVTTRAAICVEASATAPPRLVRIDLATGKRRPLDDPNANLRSRIGVEAHARAWTDENGHRFSGLLLRSAKVSRRAPLIIDYYHCDGFLRGGVGTELPMLPLAGRGVAILCIDATKLPGPQNAVASYDAALGGIRTIVDQLVSENTIDRTRVGMAGLSFGSEVTAWTAFHSNILRVAAIASAQQEPGYFWVNALPGRDVPAILKSVWQVGSPDSDVAGWQRISPAKNVEHLAIPLLMQRPESEARLSMELYARALRAGKSVELHAFADEPHILTQPRHQAASYRRTIDWFGFWLTGQTEGSDPATANQFSRWRALDTTTSARTGLGRANP
jgi:dipeptidyl aminopeptidase/acylaminoacyl peptidase